MPGKSRFIVIIRMGDANFYYHLKPVDMCESVGCLHIIRPLPNRCSHALENAIYHEIRGNMLIQRLWKTLLLAVKLGRDRDVKGFISFYTLPYGLMALLAGTMTRKPVHIGFVGDDWNTHGKAWYGPLLDLFQKRASFITVPGDTTKQELVRRGYRPDKILVLPHSVDMNKYVDRPSGEREFDCIFVGYLDRNKRVEVILRALCIVKRAYPGVRACIVGDGPQRGMLESLSEDLGLRQNVVFTGYQPDPSPSFSNARMVLIASDNEGFPFTLVEGMAAGAIPISTPVGSIPDYIRHGENGLLFPLGDPQSLADCILDLMTNKAMYETLRKGVVDSRQGFSFDRVSLMWSDWIMRYFEV